MIMGRTATFAALLLAVGLPLLVSGFVPSDHQVGKNRLVLSKLNQASGDEQQATVDRQPWDAFRFVRQSSKFMSMPFGKKQQQTVQPGTVLWTPSSSTNAFSMAPLDDVVMGGASSSSFDNDTGLWRGQVTDANNGGFIGIRSTPTFEWNMDACKGIQLKLKTSSDRKQRFKFVLRDSADFNGICWTTSIDVGGVNSGAMKLFSPQKDITTIRIPFEKQIPTLFARTVPDQTFLKDNVVGVQLAYSKFEYDGDLNPNFSLGEMDLQILEISAY